MVKGFDKFKQYFAPHSDSFIVIGGTAMQLHGHEGGLVPRVTQDILRLRPSQHGGDQRNTLPKP